MFKNVPVVFEQFLENLWKSSESAWFENFGKLSKTPLRYKYFKIYGENFI